MKENIVAWWNERGAKWTHAALVRSVRTVAQTALGIIGGSVLFSQVDWTIVVSASLLAGVLSLLTSVAGLPEAK